LHGDESVPAIDLRFSVNVSAAMLACFHPTLRWSLYEKREADGGDLADQGHECPNLRYKNLAPLGWHYEGAGYELSVSHGIGATPPIMLPDCKVNKIAIDPQEGGTVIIGFRVQCELPGEETAGKLCFLAGQPVEITLDPPDPVAATTQEMARQDA
jgi:hypothetical protein